MVRKHFQISLEPSGLKKIVVNHNFPYQSNIFARGLNTLLDRIFPCQNWGISENILQFNFQNCACCEKIHRMMNTIASIYARIFVL